MKQKLLLIFTTLLLFATACSTTTDNEISDASGREQLLQEILAEEPELGISRDLAECFIDYVVDNSPLDFEQWNTLGDDYPVSAEALEGLSQEEMEDLISVVAIGAGDCGLFDED